MHAKLNFLNTDQLSAVYPIIELSYCIHVALLSLLLSLHVARYRYAYRSYGTMSIIYNCQYFSYLIQALVWALFQC